MKLLKIAVPAALLLLTGCQQVNSVLSYIPFTPQHDEREAKEYWQKSWDRYERNQNARDVMKQRECINRQGFTAGC